ncbi:TraX family protein [Senegalia massiliensis]|uniref:Conjugal transfer protein TraX n=1 Tax=Senegalia massiliensis TaxID=1720316 RepID=A0A845QZP1_9CLOT|nr:TraX family protein [Senegalia massiliensis]NBI07640.1 hypothetical protein [Senegalia massiliensis]
MKFDTSSLITHNTDYIKVIALITMVIDHISVLFFPNIIILRIIGRVSYPLIAYLIALGYQRTSDYKSYLTRLILFSFVSAIPYYYFSEGINVIFTLSFGLMTIHFYKKNKKVISLLLIILAEMLRFSYGWYGVLMILFFNIFIEHPKKFIFSLFILNLIYLIIHNSYIQFFSMAALIFLFLKFDKKIRLSKHLFYWFYPLHLYILLIIKKIII